MGFLGNLFLLGKALRQKKFTIIETLTDSGLSIPQNNFSNTKSYLGAASAITWVNVCVSLLGEDIASTPGKILDDKNKLVEDETLTALIKRPNPLTNWYEFKEMGIWFLLLTGNIYILKTYDNMFQQRNHQPHQLWLVNPCVIKPKVDKETGMLTSYLIRHNFKEIPIEPEDIIQIKLPNPLNPYVGMGKIEANETLYNTEQAAQEFNWRFFLQGGAPDWAILSEGGIDPDSKEELKQRYKQHQGYTNSHGMIILSGGMDIKHIGLSQKDMEFFNMRKFTREEMLGIFKIPPAKAGIFETASNFTAKEQDANYWDNGVDPLLKRWDEAFTRGVIETFNPKWRYEHDDVIRRDIVADSNLANQRIFNATFSPNEAREYLGNERIENEPAMDTYYLPLNLIPISEAGLEAAESIGKSFDIKRTRLQLSILRLARNARRKVGKNIRKEMESFFGEQENDVDKLFKEVFGKKSAKQEDEREPTKAEIAEFLRRIKSELFEKTADNKLKNSIKKGHTSVMVQAIEDLNEVMDTEVDSSTQNPRVTAGIGRLARKITKVNDTTRDDIEKQIKDGVDAGESIGKLKKRIEYVYSKSKGYRAEMIARTESALAYDQGSLLSYHEAGVEFVDVIGCECNDYPCNAQNIPIDEADGLDFHPNHTGAIVPRL